MPDSQVTLVGNITRDPELKYTQSGRAVTSLGIAVSRRWKAQNSNEWSEQTSFFNVVAWGDLGENVAASIEKGARIIVVGRLEQRSYDDREGNKKSIVEVVADSIGPDLRWATAEVARTERTQQSSGGGRKAADPVYGDDEEPF